MAASIVTKSNCEDSTADISLAAKYPKINKRKRDKLQRAIFADMMRWEFIDNRYILYHFPTNYQPS